MSAVKCTQHPEISVVAVNGCTASVITAASSFIKFVLYVLAALYMLTKIIAMIVTDLVLLNIL